MELFINGHEFILPFDEGRVCRVECFVETTSVTGERDEEFDSADGGPIDCVCPGDETTDRSVVRLHLVEPPINVGPGLMVVEDSTMIRLLGKHGESNHN